LIVWIKVCFFSSSEKLLVGSSLESLFDFSAISFSDVLAESVSHIQFALSTLLLGFILHAFDFIGIEGFNLELVNFFCRKFSIFFLTFFILFVFLILVVSTFYYVRLINTVYGSPTNSVLFLDKQGLLNIVSLDVAVLIFFLFVFNVFFLLFYSQLLTFIDIFFIRFSIGF